MYLVVTHGSGRMREVLADRGAAMLYGGRAFGDGLRRVVERDAVFERLIKQTVSTPIPVEGPRLANFYALLAAPADSADNEVAAAVTQALGRTASKYDSHPPPAQRIAWTERFAGSITDHRYAAPASALLTEGDKLNDEMVAALEARISDAQSGPGG